MMMFFTVEKDHLLVVFFFWTRLLQKTTTTSTRRNSNGGKRRLWWRGEAEKAAAFLFSSSSSRLVRVEGVGTLGFRSFGRGSHESTGGHEEEEIYCRPLSILICFIIVPVEHIRGFQKRTVRSTTFKNKQYT